MLFGVPIYPMVAIGITIFLIAIWTSLFVLILIFPTILIMKLFTMQDDFIFRLYFLKIKTKTNPLNKKYYGVKTYHATKYRAMTKKVDFPKLSILGLDKNPTFEEFIPYSSLISDSVVINKEYMLISTWKVEGVPFEIKDQDSIEASKRVLNTLFKAFATEPVSFYCHNSRHKVKASLYSEFESPFLQEIDDKYYEGFKGSGLRSNSLYFTLVFNPFTNKLDLSSFIKSGENNIERELKSYLKRMTEYSNRLEANLSTYNLSKLKIYEEEGKDYSSQLEFYNFLIGGRVEKVRALNAPINEYLIGGLKNIQFNNDLLQLNFNDDSKKFARAIEIKDYTNETYIGILNKLMYLDINYTITQSFSPIAKAEAKEALVKQRKQFKASEDDSITQQEQFDIALDDLISGDISFGKYHFSIVVFGDTLKETKLHTNKIISALQDIGLGLVLADIALPATYFSQFPTNYALRPRPVPISSKNYSSLIALHNFPKGKATNTQWGDAVTILKTPNKQPYYLNLHKVTPKDDFGEFFLGNTLFIGQSGGGKTALMTFITNQLLKFDNPKTFPESIKKEKRKMTLVYLDKDKGALGNILSAGGRYVTIKNGEPTGLNPFMCENTANNIRNINNLIKILVTRNGEKILSGDEKKLSNAINFIMENFEREERKFGISLLLENLTEDHTNENSLKSRLELWKKGKKFGWVFDNENDMLDFPDHIKLYGIDGTEFLDDPEVSAPLSYYLLWRSMDLVDGRRFGLFVDEAWKWLDNPLIQEEMKNKAKTIRKQNGFIAFATQSVEDFLLLPIAKALIEQSETLIFFPNDKARETDYTKGLNCTPKEFGIIRKFNPSDYRFLVKKTSESVIASLDLNSIGKENIKILSTGEAYVNSIEEIFTQENKTIGEKVKELQELYRG